VPALAASSSFPSFCLYNARLLSAFRLVYIADYAVLVGGVSVCLLFWPACFLRTVTPSARLCPVSCCRSVRLISGCCSLWKSRASFCSVTLFL